MFGKVLRSVWKSLCITLKIEYKPVLEEQELIKESVVSK